MELQAQNEVQELKHFSLLLLRMVKVKMSNNDARWSHFQLTSQFKTTLLILTEMMAMSDP
jgi:hypothetical protein